jgi:OmpA-OmpF porin, OOP family
VVVAGATGSFVPAGTTIRAADKHVVRGDKMRKPRNLKTRTLAALIAATALAGCSDWSGTNFHGNPQSEPINIDTVSGAATPRADNFTAALAGEYAVLAVSLDHDGRLADADYFARKGVTAQRGAAVPPEDNANWAIALEQPYGLRTKLAAGRTRLLAALDGGARDRAPALAARAQARYDCWVEQTEMNWSAAQNGACATDFVAAMDQLDGKAANTATSGGAAGALINVFFEFDRARLTREALQIVTQIANQMKSRNLSATLIGKADLTGSDSYDLVLGRRRADAVAQELARLGVPRNRIIIDSFGKRQPPVKTADGVREPRNRVVEVTLK